MTKIEIEEGIIQYIFDPLPGKHFGNKIVALISENKAILIDTAYENQALQVLKDLEEKGITIEKIIISHFHDDHMRGLKLFQESIIYGSSNFGITLNMWTESDEHKFFTPNFLVNKPVTVGFGKHHLTLIPFPGHSACGIIVNINDVYVHIADELMFSNDGKPILPTVDDNNIKVHIESLNRLREYSNYILIPSHGGIIKGKEKIENEINNRSLYFNNILSNNKRLTYEEATKGCTCNFLHKEWHEDIYDDL